MRTEFIAYFIALIAIPVAQVVADTASNRHHLIICNKASSPSALAVSNYQRTKTPFDYLFLPRPQQQSQRTG